MKLEVRGTYIFIDIVVFVGRGSVDGGRLVALVNSWSGMGDVSRVRGMDHGSRIVDRSLMMYSLVVTYDVLGGNSGCVVQETSFAHRYQSTRDHDLKEYKYIIYYPTTLLDCTNIITIRKLSL